MADQMKSEDLVELLIVDDEGVEPLMDDILHEHAPHHALETELARAKAALQLSHLRNEVALLKVRLSIFSERAKATVSAQTNYVSSSAHAQLGEYPWLKLAAASCTAFIVGRLVRR